MIAVVEIPQGSYYKYEQDKKDGSLVLDRPLNQPVPYNYGFIPGTLCGDGDPLDVFILSDDPIYPLTKVRVTLVGVLRCTDNGHEDDKLLAVIAGEKEHTSGMHIIMRYLQTYKTGFVINEVGDKDKALEVYNNSVEMYEQDLRS
jgi:inorganic pyrophosphatase